MVEFNEEEIEMKLIDEKDINTNNDSDNSINNNAKEKNIKNNEEIKKGISLGDLNDKFFGFIEKLKRGKDVNSYIKEGLLNTKNVVYEPTKKEYLDAVLYKSKLKKIASERDYYFDKNIKLKRENPKISIPFLYEPFKNSSEVLALISKDTAMKKKEGIYSNKVRFIFTFFLFVVVCILTGYLLLISYSELSLSENKKEAEKTKTNYLKSFEKREDLKNVFFYTGVGSLFVSFVIMSAVIIRYLISSSSAPVANNILNSSSKIKENKVK